MAAVRAKRRVRGVVSCGEGEGWRRFCQRGREVFFFFWGRLWVVEDGVVLSTPSGEGGLREGVEEEFKVREDMLMLVFLGCFFVLFFPVGCNSEILNWRGLEIG